MSVGIRTAVLEYHLASLEHRSLGYEDNRVPAWISHPVTGQQFDKKVHVEFMLRDHAAVGRSGHGRKHRSISGVPSEDLEHENALMRTCRGPEVVDRFCG